MQTEGPTVQQTAPPQTSGKNELLNRNLRQTTATMKFFWAFKGKEQPADTG